MPDLPGSLGGGGRYDNLVGMFLGRDVPACGFSLGPRTHHRRDERAGHVSGEGVARAGRRDGHLPADDLRGDALRLANELRAERLRVEVFPEGSRKLDRSLKYASGRNVPVLAILGEDERARGEVAVRDLQTRQQDAAPRATAAKDIARRVRIEAT